MNTPACFGCDSSLDPDDNFCRRCGVPSTHAPLPVVRRQFAPAIWQPVVPPVVKGAAVMAAGTVGQYLVRRVVNNFLNPGAKPRRTSPASLRATDGLVDEAQIITETVMMRRVRIRRQA